MHGMSSRWVFVLALFGAVGAVHCGQCGGTYEESEADECSDTIYCQAYGACSDDGSGTPGFQFLKRTCAPDSDDDCERAQWSCELEGRCSFDGGECVAASDESCQNSYGCERNGRCSAKDGRCVAASDDDCSGSIVCKQFGWCEARNGGCVFGDEERHAMVEGFLETADNLPPGMFGESGPGADAASGDEAAADEGDEASDTGVKDGAAAGGAAGKPGLKVDCPGSSGCESAEGACKKPGLCDDFGLCKLEGNRCVAPSAKACKESGLCKRFGICTETDGRCTYSREQTIYGFAESFQFMRTRVDPISGVESGYSTLSVARDAVSCRTGCGDLSDAERLYQCRSLFRSLPEGNHCARRQVPPPR